MSKEHVERIVTRDFPADQYAKVIWSLARTRLALGTHYASAVERTQLAVLKLAAGNFETLDPLVKRACQDFRDVLWPAEYPVHGKAYRPGMSADELEEIYRKDREQYEAWFGGPIQWR